MANRGSLRPDYIHADRPMHRPGVVVHAYDSSFGGPELASWGCGWGRTGTQQAKLVGKSRLSGKQLSEWMLLCIVGYSPGRNPNCTRGMASCLKKLVCRCETGCA
jgi:hypothetical protein